MIRHTRDETVGPGHRNEDYEGLQEGWYGSLSRSGLDRILTAQVLWKLHVVSTRASVFLVLEQGAGCGDMVWY